MREDHQYKGRYRSQSPGPTGVPTVSTYIVVISHMPYIFEVPFTCYKFHFHLRYKYPFYHLLFLNTATTC